MTRKETEVLALAATMSAPEIAARTGRSPHTIRELLKRAKAQLGVSTITEAVAVALRAGLIPYPDATVANALYREQLVVNPGRKPSP